MFSANVQPLLTLWKFHNAGPTHKLYFCEALNLFDKEPSSLFEQQVEGEIGRYM